MVSPPPSEQPGRGEGERRGRAFCFVLKRFVKSPFTRLAICPVQVQVHSSAGVCSVRPQLRVPVAPLHLRAFAVPRREALRPSAISPQPPATTTRMSGAPPSLIRVHRPHGMRASVRLLYLQVVARPPAGAVIGPPLCLMLPAHRHRLSVCCWRPWGLLVLQVKAQEVRRAALRGPRVSPGGGPLSLQCALRSKHKSHRKARGLGLVTAAELS